MNEGRVLWASGPVLRARVSGPFCLGESVEIGPRRLLGEVVGLSGDEVIAQVYEDTTGVKPGMALVSTGGPLSVRLGPYLLGRIFDGLLRPLGGVDSAHVEAGVRAAAPIRFETKPLVKAGQSLEPGIPFAEVASERGATQTCLLPPHVAGEVETVAAPGERSQEEPVLMLRGPGGRRTPVALSHIWPVRTPRPVRERLHSREPLFTGQRVLDCLFPVALGSKAAIPGGFGTGKTVLLEALAKSCAADVIVYLGCGERGNEMAGVLNEFPRLGDPRTGRPLMERTVIIANTSNMPVAAREASIYTGVTVAEYFRDQGLHVALMADSTSRWAEALREVSGRFGELPGEGGYPAYLSSRLADFYERAAKVRTLAGGVGSVTLLGSVSPPSGDFSEPVTSHTLRYVRSLWALDTRRAHARFYPAIDPLQSYSEDAAGLEDWWDRIGTAGLGAAAPAALGEWAAMRRRFLTLLDEQARVERMARIVGKDALPARQQLTLFCAELFNEAFLRQSAFSDVDRYCGPERQARMMRLLARFASLAESAFAAGRTAAQIGQMSVVRLLQRMGEDIPEGAPERHLELEAAMESEFCALVNGEKSRAA